MNVFFATVIYLCRLYKGWIISKQLFYNVVNHTQTFLLRVVKK